MYKYLSGHKEHALQNNKYHLCIVYIDFHICASLRTSPLIVQQNKCLNYNGLYELLGLMWCERGDWFPLYKHQAYCNPFYTNNLIILYICQHARFVHQFVHQGSRLFLRVTSGCDKLRWPICDPMGLVTLRSLKTRYRVYLRIKYKRWTWECKGHWDVWVFAWNGERDFVF